MGQRANIAVVRGGERTLYYDHWAANRLDVELFWGPAAATAFAEQREPLADPRDWLDEVWGEGGAVIDHDRRDLLWFGGEDLIYELPLRRAHLALMRRVWPGWTVRWAAGGMLELGAALGAEPARILTGGDFDETFWPEGERGPPDTLVTVRRGGRTRVGRVYGGGRALAAGDRGEPVLRAAARSRTMAWSDDFPFAGVHLDADARTLGYWLVGPLSDAEARIARAWPGWRCVSWGDAFECHLEVASDVEIALPPIDLAAEQRRWLGELRRRLARPADNPARRSAEALAAAGRGPIELNPWTDVSRGSVGSRTEKLRLLDALEAALPIE